LNILSYSPSPPFGLPLHLVYDPANALIGVAPGKKLVGMVGIGILTVVPNAAFRSSAMVAALYPLGAAETVDVTAA
jgi:hypothetical protein